MPVTTVRAGASLAGKDSSSASVTGSIRGVLFAVIRDPPNGVRSIVGDEERAVGANGDADRAAPHVAVGRDEAGEEVLEFARRVPILQRHADHLVARPVRAVPR